MEALKRRIKHYTTIDDKGFAALEGLAHRIETRRPGSDIVSLGETVDYMFVIEQGWAMRYRMLDDGRRQILNFMLPGDCFDLMSLTRAKSDHAISAATQVRLRRVASGDFIRAVSQESQLAASFWWASIQEEAILREQIIRVGRRSAKERVAHLLLELNRRVAAIEGRITDFLSLPIPQTLIADALGLSVVHISRTLTKLKSDGLIETTFDGIKILEREKLVKLSDFDSSYLHFEKLYL